ncbi:MAG TPA: tetratricopeptide repeat protein [Bryobacteraceae bacterium]|jgi:Tfp pilus assembly protein PilF|nr:tetratricopeptide repeat protein [Bryobacteraceae bacterium]
MVAAAVALLFFLQAPDYDAEGVKALDAGNYQAAADSFTKAIAADPKDYYAHFNLALAYTFLKKDDEGIAEYRKTLELKPGQYEAELNGGMLLLRQKNPADALPLLEDAARQKPAEFAPVFYLAEAELQSGQADQAVEHYRQAAAIDPKSATAELGWGRALALAGKLDEAAPHFRTAIARDPRFHDALLSLADLYEERKQIPEALAIYREFPDNAAVQEHAGNLLLESKKYGEAVSQLEKAYAEAPTEANRKALAAAYLQAQQVAKALPLLEKAVADEPANYDLRLGYAHALRDSKQYPAAAVQFHEAAKLKPTEIKTWNELGSMLYLSGDRENAMAALAQARQLGDNSPGNWFLTAIMLDAAHGSKAAIARQAIAAYQSFLAVSNGKSPNQEFQARQRSKLLQRELDRR